MLYAIGLTYNNGRKDYLFMSRYRGWIRDIKFQLVALKTVQIWTFNIWISKVVTIGKPVKPLILIIKLRYVVIQIHSLGSLKRVLEILGSKYYTTDKGQHIAPKVDAKIKRLVLQKSSQKNYFCPNIILSGFRDAVY